MRILITGASSGLGEGLARAYAKDGVLLGLVARREAELVALANELRSLGAEPHVFVADVTDTAKMSEVIAEFVALRGGVDLVIANAGIGEGRGGLRYDPERVADVIRVNLIGLTNTLLPAIGPMRAQGSGTLVGMASIAGFRALPGSLAYSATKGAVMSFMEGLSMELTGTGIHAMTLAPGFVRTPLTNKNDFSMPFMIECEDACARMKKAIERKRSLYAFPLPMRVLGFLLRIAPKAVLLRVSPKSPLKKKRRVEADALVSRARKERE